MNRTQELYKEGIKLIPGATQLFSKRPEQFLPGQWPSYYSKSKGCRVWDLDAKEYIDMSFMGIGACILGYADTDVDAAVLKAVEKGNSSTLNVPEEVELARLLINLHPWADMVRYARTGGEAMAIAVRIARAAARKDTILFCGYHGWHDWYLSANLADDAALDGHLIRGLSPAGVPRGLKGTALPFQYNDTAAFDKLMDEHKGCLAAVVMEPIRSIQPAEGFLEHIRERTRRENVSLVLDEVSSGWRSAVGGAHLVFGLEPDIAVFAKGMSNGYPMAAVIGRKTTMDAAQDTFISSTYWTDRIGPSAAIASIEKMRHKQVYKVLAANGQAVKTAWKTAAEQANLEIHISGIDPLAHFDFKGKDPFALKSLFTKFMLDKGFLATNAFYASYAHNKEEINAYSKATAQSFLKIKHAIETDTIGSALGGPVCHSGFQRLA